MDFVLVSLITTIAAFLLLLFLIARVLYMRSKNKLKSQYVDKNNDGKTIIEEAEEIIENYQKALKEREKNFE